MKIDRMSIIQYIIVFIMLVVISQPTFSQYEDFYYTQEFDEWQYAFTIYSWLVGQEGSITIDGQTVDADLAFDEMFKIRDWSINGHFEAKKEKILVLLDGNYVTSNFSQEGRSVESSMTLVEGAGGYSALDHVEVFAGGRYFNINTKLIVTGEQTRKGSKGWFDPFFGGRLTINLTPRWIFSLRGDVGGFGVGSKLSLNGVAAMGFRVANFSFLAAYRAWDVLYEDGSGDNLFKYDVLMTGPGVGFTFHF
jgi:hypothetical protein